MATALPLLTGPYKIKEGALGPPYRAILRQANKQPLDLDGCTASFIMRLRGQANPTVEAEATILQEGDAETGINIGWAEYGWVSPNTDVAGVYDGEWLVIDPGGNPIRIPSDGYLEIQILGNLSAEGVG